jgi:radical SAM superfamily enzyme YgiQ (UPF0313 family)
MRPMEIALITVYSHRECTLKDVAGGYGTVFSIGDSLPARLLSRAKERLAALPSPALGYLARQAAAAGHRVRVHDIRRGAAGRDPLPEADLALVLSSIVDASAEREVLAELREAGAFTIVFGAHASMRPGFYAEVADVVVKGEPEALGARLFDTTASGVVEAGFVDDLDALPFPHWEPFPVASYRYALLSARGATLPVSGVRGCAFGCGYCPFRATSRFRQRRPERVVEEVRRLKERHGVRGIAFRDPLFNLDRDRVLALSDGLAPLDVRFSGEMRADRLDAELLARLRDAGLRSLEIGVESVDLEMLTRHKRQPPKTRVIENTIETAHRLGIRVIANFMLGLPEDDEDTIRATVAWAKRLNTFAVQFTVATPYPGTTLDSPRLPTLPPESLTGFTPVLPHPTLSPERIDRLREWAYVSYHARPRYVARFVSQAARALVD